MPFIALAVAIMLALGSGVTVIADYAHPGDTLYPVKTHVDDRIEAAITNLGSSIGIETYDQLEATSTATATVEMNAGL